ncbi:MAG: hypothetical protein FKGGLIKP_00514 [Sodalis sp. Fse]|nr:MAG: hypothetical protein FKGGLIKP_00514 [Sodalis sp. Fse]UVK78575.1 MAG: hypothetical protein IGNPGNKH_00025 [Sodalis sp. Ffu]
MLSIKRWFDCLTCSLYKQRTSFKEYMQYIISVRSHTVLIFSSKFYLMLQAL